MKASTLKIGSRWAAVALFAGLAAWAFHGGGPAFAAGGSGKAVVIPAPADDKGNAPASASGTETAVLAGGCFWGVQAVYQHVEGVTRATSGYAGGDSKSATYPIVSAGVTSHAEAVRIEFDPRRISYGRILQIYFSVAHDPTELDRQGPDVGTQYRSTIFAQSPEQASAARSYIAQLGGAAAFGAPIVTTIEQGKAFYPAEAYHQDYLVRHPTQPYIVYNDLPKIEALKKQFPQLYRTEPVLVGSAP
ncbi:peptide-methionine (S)-S-oxide reductase MsrA [Variovorax sp. OV329]|uniref:peptide-methionine (S)-S-oxide reductase MsrA n=1 Tax=Variovorax sp. OV329 TaxID=1882825 RepID=UPI0008E2F9C9|nr:peptide-methionine (S)-S-oxide reductase MsrA [Variovorax sp. OV329]SFN48990.1 peptide-methionine (S)-S-oxide reductase [Variovorax sp. OV329]